MQLGIFAKTFSRPSLGETLDAVAAHDIAAIQFNMAVAGGPSLPAEIRPAVCVEVRRAVDARGLAMSALSGTYNMAHPDPEVRADGQARLATLIDVSGGSEALGPGVSVSTRNTAPWPPPCSIQTRRMPAALRALLAPARARRTPTAR